MQRKTERPEIITLIALAIISIFFRIIKGKIICQIEKI